VVSGMSSALKLPKRLKVVLYSSVDCSCKAQGSWWNCTFLFYSNIIIRLTYMLFCQKRTLSTFV
jgi:hypothetical protein